MGFDFPNSPVEGQEFTPPNGPTYYWEPPRWMMRGTPVQVATLDDAIARIIALEERVLKLEGLSE